MSQTRTCPKCQQTYRWGADITPPWHPREYCLDEQVRRLRKALEDIVAGGCTVDGVEMHSNCEYVRIAREALQSVTKSVTNPSVESHKSSGDERDRTANP